MTTDEQQRAGPGPVGQRYTLSDDDRGLKIETTLPATEFEDICRLLRPAPESGIGGLPGESELLRATYRMLEILALLPDRELALRELLKLLAEEVPFSQSCVLLGSPRDVLSGDGVVVSFCPEDGVEARLDRRFVHEAMARRQSVLVIDQPKEGRPSILGSRSTAHWTMCAPLLADGKVLGVTQVWLDSASGFTEEYLRVLTAFASGLALLLRYHRDLTAS